MKVLIKITKEILEKSMYCRVGVGKNCAFAIAVRELFPAAWVGKNTITPFFEELIYYNELEIPMSREMTAYVRNFDSMEKTPEKRLQIPEQSFEIDIPDSVIDKIGIHQVESILSNSLTLQKV